MKNLILTGLILAGTTTVFAQDLKFADMPARLPNMEQHGTSGASYTCSVKTEWLANGDLKITGTESYKGEKSYPMEVVLKASKNVEVYTDSYDETVEYTISQSTVLLEEEDYSVNFYESFNFKVQGSKITSIHLQVAEVDHESDPHEDSIYCDFEN